MTSPALLTLPHFVKCTLPKTGLLNNYVIVNVKTNLLKRKCCESNLAVCLGKKKINLYWLRSDNGVINYIFAPNRILFPVGKTTR